MLPDAQPQVGRWSGTKSGEGLWGGGGMEIWLHELMEPGESPVGSAISSPAPTVDSGPRVSLIPSDPSRICLGGMEEVPQDPVVSNLSGDRGDVSARQVGK